MNAPHLKLVPPPPPAALARPELRVADLSPDQRAAYAGVVQWAKERPMDKQVLILTGEAGSGTSSLLGLLAREPGLGPRAFATPTGKAASVLRRKLEASGIRTNLSDVPPEDRSDGVGLVWRPSDRVIGIE